ncbi:MAG: cytochrome c4 [Betaproteobacteria bacterium]|nr:cytochrome c4 [Betaproteobacteria bacterium]
MKRVSPKASLALALLGAFGLAAHAADSAKPDDAKAQQLAATVCAACHGATGQSPLAANPHLAAQQAEYITRQLTHFKNGVRTNPIMLGMASMLEPADMKAIGQFYALQAASPAGTKDAKRAALGQNLFRYGNTANGVPACTACHAPTGAGMPAQYPRLAGQFFEYTVAQLKAFRSGERGKNDKDVNGKMMSAIATRMSEEEILGVADFLAGMR